MSKYRITIEIKTFRIKFVEVNEVYALYPTHNIRRP